MSFEDDERWQGLAGGYGSTYNPRPAILNLTSGTDVVDAWHELRKNLHHQGQVGAASYAAVPLLVGAHRRRTDVHWNTYALVGTIELARPVRGNPEVPSWVISAYDEALQELLEMALTDLRRTEDPLIVRVLLGFVALGKRRRDVARLLLELDESELQEFVEQSFG